MTAVFITLACLMIVLTTQVETRQAKLGLCVIALLLAATALFRAVTG